MERTVIKNTQNGEVLTTALDLIDEQIMLNTGNIKVNSITTDKLVQGITLTPTGEYETAKLKLDPFALSSEIVKYITPEIKTRGFEIVDRDFRKTDLNEEIKRPTRATKYSMAYDFYSPIDLVIKPGKVGKIWTDIKAYMLTNECLILNVRSSQGGQVMLANTAGWIDMDYYENVKNDGNIGIFLLNISDEDYVINKGDRIAQGAFFNFLPADNGNTYEERKGGFGSTNK